MGFLSRLFGSGPESAEEYAQRGMAHYQRGRHDKAIADYTEAIRLNPEDVEAYGPIVTQDDNSWGSWDSLVAGVGLTVLGQEFCLASRPT
jgi:tetratricopeptide (TPR) repeat protein